MFLIVFTSNKSDEFGDEEEEEENELVVVGCSMFDSVDSVRVSLVCCDEIKRGNGRVE